MPVLALSATDSRAWVQLALAAGSIVAGMIAAHNQSDGGIGGMLRAGYDLQKVDISSLMDIQRDLTTALREIEELKDRIDISLIGAEKETGRQRAEEAHRSTQGEA